MKGKRLKEEKSKFKKFLIIYSIILFILMSIFLIYVADSLIKSRFKRNTKKWIWKNRSNKTRRVKATIRNKRNNI